MVILSAEAPEAPETPEAQEAQEASALGGSLNSADALTLGHHARKLSRSVYSGSVTLALREAIVAAEIPAGTPLVERTLAEQLGVSRGPVRSALAVLEGEGLVATRPNGRMIVARFDGSDLSDLLAVRYQLESTAIRWGTAREADLKPVLTVLAEMEAEGTSTQRLVDLDIRFHRSLLELSGSRFLVQAWVAIAPLLHTVITLGNRTLRVRDPASNFNRIISSHHDVVRPLQQGIPDRALERLADQFKFTRSMFEPAPPGHRPETHSDQIPNSSKGEHAAMMRPAKETNGSGRTVCSRENGK